MILVSWLAGLINFHVGAVVAERLNKTSDVHPGGPRFEPQPGSSVLGQGALSSLPSLSEETLSRRSRV